jgi:predicted transcriptional regulator
MKKFEEIEQALEALSSLAGPAMIYSPGIAIMLQLLKADRTDQSSTLDELAQRVALNRQSLGRYLQHFAAIGVIEFVPATDVGQSEPDIRLSPDTSVRARRYFGEDQPG